jgi:hypothetical protein
MKTTNYSLDLNVFIANVIALEALRMSHSLIVCFLFQSRHRKKNFLHIEISEDKKKTFSIRDLCLNDICSSFISVCFQSIYFVKADYRDLQIFIDLRKKIRDTCRNLFVLFFSIMNCVITLGTRVL